MMIMKNIKSGSGKTYKENKEIDQDRVFDTYDHYKQFGYIMFPAQRRIYEFLKHYLNGTTIEAGGGIGMGGYIIDAHFITDKLEENIKFGKELYSKQCFDVWDITKGPYHTKFDNVVCIDAIEHCKDYEKAIQNLIATAHREVWISTPNRNAGEETTPTNQFHVREFTPIEMKNMIGDNKCIILDSNFTEVRLDTKESPLIYRIFI